MSSSYHNQALALAGVVQACALVQQVARKNSADSAALEVSLESLFKIDADSTEAVYGGIAGVRTGLKALHEQLSKTRAPANLELMRYAANVMQLERALAKNPRMLERIRTGIEGAQEKKQTLGVAHLDVIAHLAQTYTETISTLTPRIIVQGEQGYLSNSDNANKARALLLAAIRSAVLWRQTGGRRWQLLFARSALAREVAAMLQSHGENPPN
ncbi:MAG: high frequency lysogenization protein HflD [Gammaproteobacteria bacterium]|nr:high frequency lysogenization protein HflD [Gammaproteobacteria bacterium]